MAAVPAVGAAALACAAALLACQLPFHWAGLPCFALLWVCAFRLRKPIMVWIALGMAFLLLMQARLLPDRDDISRRGFALPARLTVLVEVAGDWSCRGSSCSDTSEFLIPVRLSAVRYGREWERCSGALQLRVSDENLQQLPAPGTALRVSGILRERESAWTGLRRATHQLMARGGDVYVLPPSGHSSLLRKGFASRNLIAGKLGNLFPEEPERSAVLQSLLLGMRSEFSDDWTERFARSGVIHIFAISGLHLGLLAAMLLVLLRFAGVPMTRWIHWVLPVLVLFTILTGSRASAIRACIMVGCCLLAPLCRRNPHGPSALALAAVSILLLAPAQIVELGFLYSFLLVCGILLCLPVFTDRVFAPFRADPWAPRGFRPLRRYVLFPLLGIWAMSLVTFCFSSPLTAHWFSLFSPVALVGNLVAVPLAFSLLLLGFLGLPFMVCLPMSLAALPMLPASWVAGVLLHCVGLLEHIPHGIQHVRPPETWELILLYALPLFFWALPQKRALTLAIGLSALGASAAWNLSTLSARTLVIPGVGAGQAAWLEHGSAPVIMVDVGDCRNARGLARRMKRRGIDRIAVLFLTHADASHVGGLKQLLQTFDVAQLCLPDGNQTQAQFLDVCALADQARVPVRWISAGERLMASDWTCEVLAPTPPFSHRAVETRGCVIRICNGFQSVLFMGGADARLESALLQSGQDLSARWLVAGHPTGKAGCLPEFLEAVQPEAVLFSGESYRRAGSPREIAEARVANAGAPLWRVPERGGLVISLDRGRFSVCP